jgi:hypothetical protein
VTMNSSVKRDLLIYVTILKKCLHHIEWIKNKHAENNRITWWKKMASNECYF